MKSPFFYEFSNTLITNYSLGNQEQINNKCESNPIKNNNNHFTSFDSNQSTSEIPMHKQLSKKSHKQTESSVDDFMKHIRKYNLQSERYISPKPLLYMYTNPSRNFTLHTLDKSRSKSKTLSNRQCSNSKKSSSKTIRKKVQKLLSSNYSKENIHKKSLSSISNMHKNGEKSAKKLNRSTAEVELTKSKTRLKSKLNEFKLRPMSTMQSGKKLKKSHQRQSFHPQSSSHHPLQSSIPSQSSQIHVEPANPAQLIESYSNKLFKTQLYLQSTKYKLGSFLCRKFQSILNQIVQSLVQNLKRSLNQLQKQVQDRVSKRVRQQFQQKLQQKQSQMGQLQRMCEKMTRKFTQMLHKEYYTNTLIYKLRLEGIDIDKEFGKALWGVSDLGGLGYCNSESVMEEVQSHKFISQNEKQREMRHRKMEQRVFSPGKSQKNKENPLLSNIHAHQDGSDDSNIESSDSSDTDSRKGSQRNKNSQNFKNKYKFQPHPMQKSYNKASNLPQTYIHHYRHNNQQQLHFTQIQQEIVNIQSELQQQEQQQHEQQESSSYEQYQQQQFRPLKRSL